MENPPPRWKHHLCQVRTLLCIFFDQLSLVFAALWGGLPGPVPPCLGQGCAFPSCPQEQNQVLPHPKTHCFQDTCWSFQYWARSVLQAQIYKPHNILQPWFCCRYVIFCCLLLHTFIPECAAIPASWWYWRRDAPQTCQQHICGCHTFHNNSAQRKYFTCLSCTLLIHSLALGLVALHILPNLVRGC